MWDVTCPDTLASPCLPLTTMNNCEVVAAAETQNLAKYAHLDCHFAIELLVAWVLEPSSF